MTAQDTRPGNAPMMDVTSAETRWTLALDQLEADLAEVEQALADGEEIPESDWVEPVDLGPAPVALQERMQELAARIGQAQQQAQGQLTELHQELGEVDRRRQAGAAYGIEVGRTA